MKAKVHMEKLIWYGLMFPVYTAMALSSNSGTMIYGVLGTFWTLYRLVKELHADAADEG